MITADDSTMLAVPLLLWQWISLADLMTLDGVF
jgi:hypothetical protein